MMVEKILVTVATVLSLSASAMKKNVQIFAVSVAANLLMGISYLVLGGAKIATAMAFVGATQGIVSAVYSARGERFPKKLKPLFFVLYSLCGAMNFKKAYDVLPFVASMIALTAGFQKDEQKLRLFCIANSLVWILYDVIVGAAALYSHILYLAINVISMIWYSERIRAVRKKI